MIGFSFDPEDGAVFQRTTWRYIGMWWRSETEEHIFWDRKLYEDQRATMMDILRTAKKNTQSQLQSS
jgi:hypothetical protein